MADLRSVLLIDNDPGHVEVFRGALLIANDGPFHGEYAQTLSQGVERLRQKGMWAIFANLSLPDSQGLDTFRKLLQAAPDVPTLILGGIEDEAIATEALRHGAKDYLLEGHIDTYSFARAIRNMAERKATEEAFFAEKERAQVTLNSIGDAVLSTDALGNVTYLNAVAEKMTGWSREEALGKPLAKVFEIIDGTTREPSPDPMELAVQEDKTVGLAANCVLIRRDGFESPIEDCAAPIHDRSGLVIGAVIVFHDVSMSRAMALEMSHLAQHDILTDLPNRVLLKDRVSQAIAAARRNNTPIALLFLDLDGFKHINDSLGHAVGDKLLQSVATRLVSCVRSSDTVSRQGGDEFVVLLSEIKHVADAGITARKIITALTAPHVVDQHELHVTASIGLSTYPDDGRDTESLIKAADTAMYQAKEKGRNNYQFFKKNMNVRAVSRQSIEGGLRRALRRQEFVLHYQPRISLETGKITGVEALIRWMHPDLGLVPPLHFLPIAEDCGLILPIGQWVLRETCRQVREWIDSGLRVVPAAVNVSCLEFLSEGFLEGLRTILKDTCMDPCYLDLELTETVLMQHAESTVSVLSALKSIGVRLAVDDFGTGYSSLSYLKRFSPDSVKIDQSFLHDVTINTDDATIVSAVISMAKSLNKRVIAEGVESEEQVTFLRVHGCDEAQGNYFSTPVVAEQFAKLLEPGIASFVSHPL
jgi:diguanylate cyclase (GGDEF)-like protein/PAS domain S-box-containing protein